MDGREQASKAYANQAYEQPYNTAMYTAGVLLEARRWHVAEYEAVAGDLTAEDLTVGALPSVQHLHTRIPGR